MITLMVVVKVSLQLVDQVQLLHGVNQHLDTKLERLRNIQINLLSKIEELSSLRRIVSSLHNLDLSVYEGRHISE
ncbi:protein of unknown function [Clostridium beijerinckii]|nr:protein of unknown function [Clostridium beijerinckii]